MHSVMHADFAMLPARYSGGTHSFSRQVGLFSGVSAEDVVEKTVPLQCLFVIFIETMEEPVVKKARFAQSTRQLCLQRSMPVCQKQQRLPPTFG